MTNKKSGAREGAWGLRLNVLLTIVTAVVALVPFYLYTFHSVRESAPDNLSPADVWKYATDCYKNIAQYVCAMGFGLLTLSLTSLVESFLAKRRAESKTEEIVGAIQSPTIEIIEDPSANLGELQMRIAAAKRRIFLSYFRDEPARDEKTLKYVTPPGTTS
ncbi:MAG TPA: hypothetical protein VHU80_02645 [Polyangiaceae bacterium]|nr:hypothetical protein [Polyangiaceae bacterium]